MYRLVAGLPDVPAHLPSNVVSEDVPIVLDFLAGQVVLDHASRRCMLCLFYIFTSFRFSSYMVYCIMRFPYVYFLSSQVRLMTALLYQNLRCPVEEGVVHVICMVIFFFRLNTIPYNSWVVVHFTWSVLLWTILMFTFYHLRFVCCWFYFIRINAAR